MEVFRQTDVMRHAATTQSSNKYTSLMIVKCKDYLIKQSILHFDSKGKKIDTKEII